MDAAEDGQDGLVDLSNVNLEILSRFDLGQNALAHSIRRVLDDADKQQDAVAGWNSAI